MTYHITSHVSRITHYISRARHLFAMLLCVGFTADLAAQGTTFTYQGRLTDNGALANGAYDFQFNLFAASTGGNPLTNMVAVNDLAISEGVFTVLLDFGAGVFTGGDRFLEISVRDGASGGPFRILSPRQRVTPTPYAIVAGSVNGFGSINASQLTTGTVPSSALDNAWKITGNTTPGPHFLGTLNNQPVELKVNGDRALRLEPNTNGAPNIIGGAPVNFTFPDVVGATISGGGAANYFGSVLSNSVNRDFGAIGGGINNTIEASAGAIAGGENNFIGPKGVLAAIGGGSRNTNSGSYAVIPGGRDNRALGVTSFAAGNRAKANHNGTFVWADSQLADFASTTSDQFLIRAANGVGIGTTNPINRLTVSGAGSFNTLSAAAITLNNTNPAGHNWEWHALDDGRMQFVDATVGSGGTRLLINTSGNVGIGTATPSRKLEVSSSGSTEIGLNSTDTGAHLWTLQSTLVGTGDARDGSFQVIDRTLNTARLLIGTNGFVGIGTTTPDFLLEVNGSAGKPGGGSWSSTSDSRLKKNIRPLAGALDKLLALRGVNFEYLDPEQIRELPGERIGLIAQEVEKVFPDWVETGPDGYKRVTVRGLEALVVEALRQLRQEENASFQKLNHKVEDLKAELRRRDTDNAELRQRLEALEKNLNPKE